MIPFHGTPIGGDEVEASRFLAGRHAFISFAHPDHLAVAAEVCQSFAFDNGAFSAWKRGKVIDFAAYERWVDDWKHHPGFEWAVIPDVIDGTEKENDALIRQWTLGNVGVPVWHMHESLERLRGLCGAWPRVAIGSSGKYSQPGSDSWWTRMGEAMDEISIGSGKPMAKLHGLRMLNPAIFTRLPLASADSTNAAQNNGTTRVYQSPRAGTRAQVIAERVEKFQSAEAWQVSEQPELFALR